MPTQNNVLSVIFFRSDNGLQITLMAVKYSVLRFSSHVENGPGRANTSEISTVRYAATLLFYIIIIRVQCFLMPRGLTDAHIHVIAHKRHDQIELSLPFTCINKKSKRAV